MTSEAFAPAKINLTLHVTGQRGDGYHLLDSLVMFGDVGDRLWFDAGPTLGLEVSGPFAKGVPTDARNLVWQAAQAAGFVGHIHLQKNLPHGAGIGGGSSDAAAVLRTFGAQDAAARLGADVPVCLAGTAQRMQGIGERLSAVSGLTRLWAVLVNPGVTVPTPSVFAVLACKINPPMPDTLPHFEDSAKLIGWVSAMRNDLELSAVALAPEIGTVLTLLSNCAGAGLARMSGSGGTCFALFAEEAAARKAALDLAQDRPGWWVQACALS